MALHKFILTGTGLLILPALLATLASAQQTSSSETSGNVKDTGLQKDYSSKSQIDEIVVTAQRRAENLQDVPVAVSALSATAIASANLVNVTDLGNVVPSLNIVNNNGFLSTSLRGVGSTGINPGFENPVAIYVDGVYIATTTGNFLNLADVSQVDVLKGPQGTLFGRNATAGLLQVTTRTPTQTPTLSANLSYENYNTVEGSTYVAGGLAKNVAASLSVYGLHQGDGFGTNLTTGKDAYKVDRDISIRAKLAVDLPSSTTIIFSGDYSTQSRNDTIGGLLPGTINPVDPASGPVPDRGYNQVTDYPNSEHSRTIGGSATIDQEIGTLQLKSITAYRDSRTKFSFDGDQSSIPFLGVEWSQPEDQLTQEFQLQPIQPAKLNWVAGAYYFLSHAAYDPLGLKLLAFGQTVDIFNRQRAESYAGYTQATYEILPNTNFTLGGRYTAEKRSVFDGLTTLLINASGMSFPTPAPDESATFNKFTFRASLDHRFSPEVFGYVSVNRGFKSGGYNTAEPGSEPYRPETIDAYEIGLKNDLFDRRARVNVAGYFYNYKDIQSQILIGTNASILNASSAHIYGLDADFQVKPTDRLELGGGIGIESPKYRYFPNALISTPLGGTPLFIGSAAGNLLPLASKFTANLNASYTSPLAGGHLVSTLNGSYRSTYFLESDNVVKQPSFTLVNANFTWTSPSDHYSVGLFGRNLTDKKAITFSSSSTAGAHGVLYSPPRIYGVTAGMKF